MKLTIEVDCSPDEARAFLGLPDVQGINERLVDELQARLSANMAKLSPDELLKTWTNIGVNLQDQLRRFMTAATDLANRSTDT